MYPKIKQLRLSKGLTQKKIAEVLHVSQATYSKYETGERDLPAAALLCLARFYKTSTDFILDRSSRQNLGL